MNNYGIGNFNSFLLAVLFYVLVIAFIFFRFVQMQENAIRYTDIQDSFVDIELADPAPATPKPIATPQPKQVEEEVKPPEPEPEKIQQETTNKAVETSPIKQEATNFDALFGDVKEIQVAKDTKVQSSKKSDSKTSTPKNSASEIVKKATDNLLQDENQGKGENTQKQRTGVYDAFLGRVTRVIQERWSLYYPNSKKITVVVKIFIDKDGNFGYTEVAKSYNEAFDSKVLEFLEGQKGKFIANPPKSQQVNITMNLGDDIEVVN
ncbi:MULTISPECIES: TonB C-terminal domain-containing protein [unclassified Campylobacter]|uniref:TonB C-terminal domain-containing protein n=1 Tax=unclassified Campylobacter TaxID=2593542 RepID=UPI001237C941|nr:MULTISPECIES: TonB C-terminal domain-containing protein [unclassified Campylobacter]KAA6227313.1 energy transducer TonB [Campylobacter sp. LR286c]KAA6227812.1 energy transducer TonB [Campylobacter sp. LR185c]KAA6228220.1 energy transducer TonB [Campylobacter sp. LR196d]KAA6229220.1 energy transducer TonB [Campylobacter sp. LR291e]KAA6231025.1 energy transducer TonB [Campylobacter sp. LR264d]